MTRLLNAVDIVDAVPLSGSPLDRRSDLRTPESLAELAAREDAKVLVLWKGQAAITGDIQSLSDPFLTPVEAAYAPGAASLEWRAWPEGADSSAAVFLGLTPDGAPRFALDVSAAHPDDAPPGSWSGLREALPVLSPDDAAIFAVALGAVNWRRSHPRCARCGGVNQPADGGWKAVCLSCATEHFPRTDPVVIMLPVRGDTCLLGRQATWPEGRYSMLAGFMEPGETMEEAVRRETMEEVGVGVGAVSYVASQPWPFPGSLMLGCVAEALHEDLTLDPVEIEDAQWFTRAEVAQALAGEHAFLRAPLKGAIARTVVEAWARQTL